MKKYILSLIPILLLFGCNSSDELIALSVEAQIERLVKPYTDFGMLTGVSIGTWDNGEINIYHFGKADAEAGISPSDTTIYALGRISEVFTGILASDLIQEGKLSLNDTLDELLPSNLPVFGNEKIRIIDLATHTTGLLSEVSDEYADLSQQEQALFYRDYQSVNLYTFLSSTSLSFEPGTRYQYSKLGMVTLAQVIANRTGVTLDEFFQERIARSVGMVNTQTLPNFTNIQYNRLAPAYSPDQEKRLHYRYGSFIGSEGFYSTVEDLIHFVDAQMNPFHPLSDAFEFSQESRFDLGGENGVGIGWLIDDSLGETNIFQSGASSHAAYMGLIKNRGVGVVVLTNTNSESSVRIIGQKILNMLGR